MNEIEILKQFILNYYNTPSDKAAALGALGSIGKQLFGWIKITEDPKTRPSQEDGDSIGDIMWWDSLNGYAMSDSWDASSKYYTHWMPFPKKPKD